MIDLVQLLRDCHDGYRTSASSDRQVSREEGLLFGLHQKLWSSLPVRVVGQPKKLGLNQTLILFHWVAVI